MRYSASAENDGSQIAEAEEPWKHKGNAVKDSEDSDIDDKLEELDENKCSFFIEITLEVWCKECWGVMRWKYFFFVLMFICICFYELTVFHLYSSPAL